jgi:hypothetical protein
VIVPAAGAPHRASVEPPLFPDFPVRSVGLELGEGRIVIVIVLHSPSWLGVRPRFGVRSPAGAAQLASR